MIGNIMEKIKSSLIFFRLPLLSGFLIGTSYIPFPPWAALFGLVPLWYFWWQNPRPRVAFWGGCVTSFVFTLIGFHWVAHTFHEFGHIPWILSLLILLLFCFLGHLHFALAGCLWAAIIGSRRARGSERYILLLLPVLTILCEHYYPMIFAWNFGYTWLYSRVPLFHTAELIGFSGLSAWVIFTNLAFFVALLRLKSARPWWPPIGVAVGLFCVMILVGLALEKRLPTPDKKVGILAVQANIGNLEKQYAERGWGFRDHIIDRYTQLSLKGLAAYPREEIDFALWPETAFPDQIVPRSLERGYSARLTDFLRNNSLALVTGAYSEDLIQRKPTNSLFSFSASGNLTNPPYHKTLLLAFGEYTPFGDMFPALKRALPQVSDFARGSGPTLLEQNGVHLGAQICYEGLFPEFTQGLANLGAQIIINVTNDSWYGKSSQPHQHLYMTLARAIEFRRPIVRSTNTGFTTVAQANGEIMEISPLHQEWFHLFRIPYREFPSATFFQTTGIYLIPTIIWILFFISLGGVFYCVRFRNN
jgi:apolipoprotein N-acyltransferase